MKHLYENYYLNTDRHNYIIAERKVKQSGKNKGSEYFEEVAYFGSVNSLKKYLVELKVREGIVNTEYDELLKFANDIMKIKEGEDE